MGTKNILIFIILFSLSIAFVSAYSTQQYNKIYLNPFYRESMTQNLWYNYTVDVNPPDRIREVKSAIIFFDAYINPTRNFTIMVNDQYCNPPSSFYISTTYSGASQARIYFDCSNVIKKEGTYKVSLRVTGGNIGAIIGWLDLTYMNNPFGDLKLMGTDYFVGDRGTLFLQLKDSYGQAVNNGNCYLNVYYPYTYNSSHAIMLQDAPMMYKDGSNGLYYYDLIIPNYTGVYMVDAECSYVYQPYWYYLGSMIEKPNRTVISGTYIGDTFYLNDYEDLIYTKCSGSGGSVKMCDAYYDFVIDKNSTESLDVYWSGESDKNPTLIMYAWNWTGNSWVKLPNNLTLSATGSSVPIGLGEMLTNTISNLNDTIANNGSVRIRTYSYLGTSFTMFDNFLALKSSKRGSFIQDIKGSGEINVISWDKKILYEINETLYNQTQLIKDVNSTIIGFLQDTNTSHYNLLLQINDTINNVFINETNLHNYLISMNNSLSQEIQNSKFEILGVISSSNNTQISYLIDINNTIHKIDVNVTELIDYTQNMNSSLSDLIDLKSNEIIGIINNINASQYVLLLEMNDSLYEVKMNITDVYDFLKQANNTIFDNIILLNQSLFLVNDSITEQISHTNQSITNQIINGDNYIISLINSNNQTYTSFFVEMNGTLYSIKVDLNDLYDYIQNANMSLTNLIISENDLTRQQLNFNTTQILNEIRATNTTLFSHLDSVNATIIGFINDVNTSQSNLIYGNKILLLGINSQLYEINTTSWDIFHIIENTNISLSNQIYAVNQSLFNYIDSNFAELKGIIYDANNTQMTFLIEINETTHSITEDGLSGLLQQINQSLTNNLFIVNDNLSNLIKATNSSIISVIQDVNSTTSTILLDMNGTLVYTKVKSDDIYNMILLTNTSISDLVYGRTQEIMNQMNYNTTQILDEIRNTNSTLFSKLDNVNASIIGMIQETNTSQTNILLRIEDRIIEINATSYDIWNLLKNTNSSITSQILAVNQSLFNKIETESDRIIGIIQDVNSTQMTFLIEINGTVHSITEDGLSGLINAVNQSITNNLYIVNDSLSNEIQTSKGEIISVIQNTNSSLYSILYEINGTTHQINVSSDQIKNLILLTNASLSNQISETNSTITNTIMVVNQSLSMQINATNSTLSELILNRTQQILDLENLILNMLNNMNTTIYDIKNLTIEITDNFDILWNHFNCTYSGYKMCNLLIDLNRTKAVTGSFGGGGYPTTMLFAYTKEPEIAYNFSDIIQIKYNNYFETAPDNYHKVILTVENLQDYTINFKIRPLDTASIYPEQAIYVEPHSEVPVELYLPIHDKGLRDYNFEIEVNYLGGKYIETIKITGVVSEWYFLYKLWRIFELYPLLSLLVASLLIFIIILITKRFKR